jgi:hypothetical protein
VCKVGGERRWASGTIQAINEDDPGDPTGQAKLPYVVKMDPPKARLISVPKDINDLVRAEVCFGQRAGALWFTLFCAPQRIVKTRRFGVGERVSCAVEDTTDNYTIWAAGTVTEVSYSVASDASEMLPDRGWSGHIVPYRVELDVGGHVLVHRDEHWLIRDLTLQPAGPRQAADGTRCLERIGKRQREEGAWEAIDHTTRRVRPADAPGDGSDDD